MMHVAIRKRFGIQLIALVLSTCLSAGPVARAYCLAPKSRVAEDAQRAQTLESFLSDMESAFSEEPIKRRLSALDSAGVNLGILLDRPDIMIWPMPAAKKKWEVLQFSKNGLAVIGHLAPAASSAKSNLLRYSFRESAAPREISAEELVQILQNPELHETQHYVALRAIAFIGPKTKSALQVLPDATLDELHKKFPKQVAVLTSLAKGVTPEVDARKTDALRLMKGALAKLREDTQDPNKSDEEKSRAWRQNILRIMHSGTQAIRVLRDDRHLLVNIVDNRVIEVLRVYPDYVESIGSLSPNAVEELDWQNAYTPYLIHEDERTRWSLNDLIKDLHSKNFIMLHMSLQAIAMMGPNAARAAPDLIALLPVQEATMQSLIEQALFKMGVKAVPALLEARRNRDPFVRGFALDQLGALTVFADQWPEGQRVFEEIAESLEDTNELDSEHHAVRDAAYRVLTRIGKPAIPALQKVIRDRPEKIKQLAALAWADIDLEAEEPRRLIALAIANETLDEEFRDLAALYLPGLLPNRPDDAASSRQMAYAGKIIAPKLIEWMKDYIPWTDHQGHLHQDHDPAIATFTGVLVKIGEPAVPSLIEALSNDQKRISAARVLGKIGPAAKPAIPKLLECLNVSDGYDPHIFRKAVVEAIVAIDASVTPELVDKWVNALDDPAVETRLQAVKVLGTLGHTAAKALPKLHEIPAKELRHKEVIDDELKHQRHRKRLMEASEIPEEEINAVDRHIQQLERQRSAHVSLRKEIGDTMESIQQSLDALRSGSSKQLAAANLEEELGQKIAAERVEAMHRAILKIEKLAPLHERSLAAVRTAAEEVLQGLITEASKKTVNIPAHRLAVLPSNLAYGVERRGIVVSGRVPALHAHHFTDSATGEIIFVIPAEHMETLATFARRMMHLEGAKWSGEQALRAVLREVLGHEFDEAVGGLSHTQASLRECPDRPLSYRMRYDIIEAMKLNQLQEIVQRTPETIQTIRRKPELSAEERIKAQQMAVDVAALALTQLDPDALVETLRKNGRLKAVQSALSRGTDDAMADAVIPMLRSSSPNTRAFAEAVLVKIGASAVKPLLRHMPDGRIRPAIEKIITKIGTAAYPALLEQLGEENRGRAAGELLLRPYDKTIIPELLAKLESPNAVLRRNSEQVLKKWIDHMGAEGWYPWPAVASGDARRGTGHMLNMFVRPLLQILGSTKSKEQRLAAIRLLEPFKKYGLVEDALRALLTAEDTQIRHTAALAFGDQAPLQELLEVLNDDAMTIDQKTEALSILSRMPTLSSEHAHHFVPLLGHTVFGPYAENVLMGMDIGSAPALMQGLENDHAGIWKKSAILLVRLGASETRSRMVFHLLDQALSDPRKNMRAAFALMQDERMGIPILCEALNNPDKRVAAWHALSRSEKAADKILRAKSVIGEDKALQLLLAIGRGAVQDLLPALKHQDVDMRAFALRVLDEMLRQQLLDSLMSHNVLPIADAVRAMRDKDQNTSLRQRAEAVLSAHGLTEPTHAPGPANMRRLAHRSAGNRRNRSPAAAAAPGTLIVFPLGRAIAPPPVEQAL